MSNLWSCRRTWVATLSIVLLFVLGYLRIADVGSHIVAVAVAVCAANAAQRIMTNGK